MPKRTDISSIMIIGAGPIIIGQACEFDYSGAQACKALREEGYRVILVNSKVERNTSRMVATVKERLKKVSTELVSLHEHQMEVNPKISVIER